MDKPKFTEGPWHVFENQPTVVGTQEKNVCKCELDWNLQADERKANAALIAAAPEMYDFIHFFETFSGQAYLRILPDESGRKIYEDAVRLCKKARGEL